MSNIKLDNTQYDITAHYSNTIYKDPTGVIEFTGSIDIEGSLNSCKNNILTFILFGITPKGSIEINSDFYFKIDTSNLQDDFFNKQPIFFNDENFYFGEFFEHQNDFYTFKGDKALLETIISYGDFEKFDLGNKSKTYNFQTTKQFFDVYIEFSNNLNKITINNKDYTLYPKNTNKKYALIENITPSINNKIIIDQEIDNLIIVTYNRKEKNFGNLIIPKINLDQYGCRILCLTDISDDEKQYFTKKYNIEDFKKINKIENFDENGDIIDYSISWGKYNYSENKNILIGDQNYVSKSDLGIILGQSNNLKNSNHILNQGNYNEFNSSNHIINYSESNIFDSSYSIINYGASSSFNSSYSIINYGIANDFDSSSLIINYGGDNDFNSSSLIINYGGGNEFDSSSSYILNYGSINIFDSSSKYILNSSDANSFDSSKYILNSSDSNSFDSSYSIINYGESNYFDSSYSIINYGALTNFISSYSIINYGAYNEFDSSSLIINYGESNRYDSSSKYILNYGNGNVYNSSNYIINQGVDNTFENSKNNFINGNNITLKNVNSSIFLTDYKTYSDIKYHLIIGEELKSNNYKDARLLLGQSNEDKKNTIVEIANEGNIFEIDYQTGATFCPKLAIKNIDNANDKILITKEYLTEKINNQTTGKKAKIIDLDNNTFNINLPDADAFYINTKSNSTIFDNSIIFINVTQGIFENVIIIEDNYEVIQNFIKNYKSKIISGEGIEIVFDYYLDKTLQDFSNAIQNNINQQFYTIKLSIQQDVLNSQNTIANRIYVGLYFVGYSNYKNVQ